ncbi:helix-turn-helix transcriptional regulator [Acidithiobacillus ferrooxidans]|uniref:ArsR/SmtB family transcription factor n=1 Tax=Acidithiobacillus ferrooxidans TaxID=920 RepID=UPI001C067861|nr:metalloregulator ArsR/SmtB family transcription factor [Acidithiobacillus ferrooxidans]MBU2856422.1 helix-turn-helix transcriptional regulator [Acidithiobacillus ferrooxidans]MBU2860084.1 helix-turn-helix transcriptional regulator [Acidithiobacillus ferrooxidans]
MNFRESDQAQVIPALKVLGEANRLRILCELGLECRPVTDVINATGLGQTNVSFHLRVLREAGFVRAERRGPFIYYCLADPELLRILHDLKQWLDTRQAPVAGINNQLSRPTRYHSAGARTRGG